MPPQDQLKQELLELRAKSNPAMQARIDETLKSIDAANKGRIQELLQHQAEARANRLV